MLSVGGLLLVMLRSAFIVAFLSIPNPVVALSGFKTWSRKALYTKIDLCTQSCYSQILPGLYLSNARAAADGSVLRHLGITHVLTIEAHRLPKSVFMGSNISTLFIRATDSPQTNLMPYFPLANAFINEGLHRGNVLVHCELGVSRSPTLVIAYIMERYRLPYQNAFEFVKQRRRFINPNPGFVAQLKEYHRLGYDVKGYQKLEAYMNIYTRKHRVRLASIAAVCVGVLVPAVMFLGLYLSNASAARDKLVLRRLNITHILTVEAQRIPKSIVTEFDIKTLFIRALDLPQTNLLPYFPMANAFINDGLQKGNVLVHCHFGVSRSATIVIAYLMEKFKMTYEQAYDYVRERRQFINPNPGFITQLKKYRELNYDVNNFQKLEAYMHVKGRKQKYKIASAAAVIVGIMVPVIILL